MTSVMVVDDDQDLAEMLGIVLNGVGIEVDLVSRGDEVLEVFQQSARFSIARHHASWP